MSLIVERIIQTMGKEVKIITSGIDSVSVKDPVVKYFVEQLYPYFIKNYEDLVAGKVYNRHGEVAISMDFSINKRVLNYIFSMHHGDMQDIVYFSIMDGNSYIKERLPILKGRDLIKSLKPIDFHRAIRPYL